MDDLIIKVFRAVNLYPDRSNPIHPNLGSVENASSTWCKTCNTLTAIPIMKTKDTNSHDACAIYCTNCEQSYVM